MTVDQGRGNVRLLIHGLQRVQSLCSRSHVVLCKMDLSTSC